MNLTRIFIVIFPFFAIVHELDAQAQTPRELWETLNLIRREKFDIILPDAMRDNAIDMWIHAIQRGNPDPLALDLGGNGGYFIFTDRGENRIEWAVLGGGGIMLEKSGAYDIFGSQEDLRQFVSERDQQRIGANMSEWIAVADGLSHTRYRKLVETLGE